MASPPQTWEEYLPTMLGSATSGLIARIPCHPIDTIKARLQVRTDRLQSSSAWTTIRDMWRTGGIRPFYRGFGITFLGSAPSACLYFTTYEWAKNSLLGPGRVLEKSPASAHFLAGMTAETISCVFWVPIDVIKERMQVQTSPEVLARQGSTPGHAHAPTASSAAHLRDHFYYRNTLDAVRQIMATEGLRGIYKGYGATVVSFGPFSAFYFLLYEQGKNYLLRSSPTASRELSFTESLLAAAAAGSTAAVLTNPLDIAKLRLQVQRANLARATARADAAGAALGTAASAASAASASAASAAAAATEAGLPSFRYSGMWDALQSIVRKEGVRALFRGAGSRVAFHAPSTAISMSVFESCRTFYASALRPDDSRA